MSLSLWLSAAARSVLLPPTNLLLVTVAGFVLCRWRPALGRAIAASGAVLLALLCVPAVSNLLVSPLENQTTPLTASERARGQAIVVLAAGSMEHAAEFEDQDIPDYVALGRLRYAARLQHQTGLPLLVSGGNAPPGEPQRAKAEGMATALREDFRTPVRWIETRSENTEQNARYSAQLLRSEGIERILLVTDAMHMARARLAFQQAGLQTIAAPTLFFRLQRLPPQAFLPSAEGLRLAWYASYEWLGLLWYRLRLGAAAAPSSVSPARTT